jgi:hypothetical protein
MALCGATPRDHVKGPPITTGRLAEGFRRLDECHGDPAQHHRAAVPLGHAHGIAMNHAFVDGNKRAELSARVTAQHLPRAGATAFVTALGRQAPWTHDSRSLAWGNPLARRMPRGRCSINQGSCMRNYDLCAACACHIEVTEERCPFCGAPHRPRAQARRSAPPRTSRAEWLAFGSALALTACSERAPAPSPSELASDAASNDAPAPEDATTSKEGDDGDDGAVDALVEAALDAHVRLDVEASSADVGMSDVAAADVAAGASDAARLGAWLASGNGSFPCSATQLGQPDAADCDRATQWCYTNHGFLPTGCVSLATACSYADISAPCLPAIEWDPGRCDGGIRRCDCLNVKCSSGLCADDDAGGVTVSCGACYGAPPARLERWREASARNAHRGLAFVAKNGHRGDGPYG